jgi:hypothetical protein
MRHPLALLAPLLAVGLAPPARAADAAPGPRVEVLPAWTETIPCEEVIPAVYREERVPIYETVREPVMGTEQVPAYETVLEPVYELRPVPHYEVRKVPVMGEVTVPVYAVRRVPVTLPTWIPCTWEEGTLTLWHREEKVQVGVKREAKLLGYREERVPCGWIHQKVQVGVRRVERCVGCEERPVLLGWREVRRRTGWATNVVLVCPEQVRTWTRTVVHPARRVTVVPDGWGPCRPLAGTSEVLADSAFRARRTG